MSDKPNPSERLEFTVDQLDYCLPEELIAQHPPARREDARLLIVERRTGSLRDSRITEFPDILRPGDLLVLNDTKVVPAKFVARRRTGGRVAGLFLSETEPGTWEVLLEGSRRLGLGESIELVPPTGAAEPVESPRPALELLERLPEGRWRVRVNSPLPPEQILEAYGETPLPPYIARKTEPARETLDRERYQTVYARHPGAVAAPTAGLHLTESLLHQVRDRSIDIASITLHVGLGTFKPLSVPRLQDHVMHEERFEVPAATLQAIDSCRRRAGRIVAVGTTTVRVLETLALASINNRQSTIDNPMRGGTNIFIYPPYQFRLVDSLLTNFHLPRSTLLALVIALAGVDLTRRAYEHAVAARYRFYSYGDAMLIV